MQQAQREQTQENCTLQELEKIAEEVNLSIELLHDAAKTVLMHREQQALEHQQKERDRQERRERAITTLKQYTRKALLVALAAGGLALVVVTIKNMMPTVNKNLLPTFIQLPGAEVVLSSLINQIDIFGGITITGTLRSAKFCKYATLYFRIYDSDGNELGWEHGRIDNLKAGELWHFGTSSYTRGADRFEVDRFSCESPIY